MRFTVIGLFGVLILINIWSFVEANGHPYNELYFREGSYSENENLYKKFKPSQQIEDLLTYVNEKIIRDLLKSAKDSTQIIKRSIDLTRTMYRSFLERSESAIANIVIKAQEVIHEFLNTDVILSDKIKDCANGLKQHVTELTRETKHSLNKCAAEIVTKGNEFVDEIKGFNDAAVKLAKEIDDQFKDCKQRQPKKFKDKMQCFMDIVNAFREKVSVVKMNIAETTASLVSKFSHFPIDFLTCSGTTIYDVGIEVMDTVQNVAKCTLEDEK